MFVATMQRNRRNRAACCSDSDGRKALSGKTRKGRGGGGHRLSKLVCLLRVPEAMARVRSDVLASRGMLASRSRPRLKFTDRRQSCSYSDYFDCKVDYEKKIDDRSWPHGCAIPAYEIRVRFTPAARGLGQSCRWLNRS